MFDFEKLEVYQKAKIYNKDVVSLILGRKDLDRFSRDQLRRAAMSIVLNIAEGSGRFSNADRCNFYVIARGSVFECVALLEIIRDVTGLESDKIQSLYASAEELSKMLYSMIRNLRRP